MVEYSFEMLMLLEIFIVAIIMDVYYFYKQFSVLV